MITIKETEEKGYTVFANTNDNYRAVKIIENDLIEINNEYGVPFSPKNTKMVFTLGGLRNIIKWAETEIEKRKQGKK
ncbi:MAG TPA: hypothetical protein VI727_09865 [Candidatus Brocadiaceae bacterium]|nr:hypothetical protein [Candidatus Brocadiaceae bacterium]